MPRLVVGLCLLVLATAELQHDRSCGAASFPFPRSDIEMIGVTDAPAHKGRVNSSDCLQVCCATVGCTLWQWKENETIVPGTGRGINACRIGSGQHAVYKSKGWVGGGTTKAPPVVPGPVPTPPPPPPPPTPPPLLKSLVSNTLGSHMVLQRAPAVAVVWGFAAAGSTITTTLDAGTPLKSTADATGTWRQSLPPTPSGGESHVIRVESSEGNIAPVTLSDVVFGEVYVCG
jgi:hypothetical protein